MIDPTDARLAAMLIALLLMYLIAWRAADVTARHIASTTDRRDHDDPQN